MYISGILAETLLPKGGHYHQGVADVYSNLTLSTLKPLL